MSESATARREPEEAEWDEDEILADLEISDEAPETEEEATADDPDDLENLPSEEEPAGDQEEPPVDAESDEPAATATGPSAPADATGRAPTAGNDTQADTGPRPLTLRADGRDIAPEGSFEIDGMAVIPMEVLRTQLLANHIVGDRQEHARTVRDLQKQVQSAKEERTAKEAQFDALITQITGFLEDPDTLADFLADFDRQRDILLAKAETEAARQEANNLRSARTAEEREREAAEEPIRRQQGLQHWVHQMVAGTEEIPGLDLTALRGVPLNEKELVQFLSDPAIADRVFVQAPEDPEEATLLGVEPGQTSVDLGYVYTLLRREADHIRRLQTGTKTAVETARGNGARVSGGARKQAGPSVSSEGVQVTTRPQPKEIKSLGDLRKELDEIDIDDILGD